MAVHIGLGNFAVMIGVNIFRTQDAPRYIFARTSLHSYTPILGLTDVKLDTMSLMFVGIGFISVFIAVAVYMHINAKRDALACNSENGVCGYSLDELRDMGDRAPSFRYTL